MVIAVKVSKYDTTGPQRPREEEVEVKHTQAGVYADASFSTSEQPDMGEEPTTPTPPAEDSKRDQRTPTPTQTRLSVFDIPDLTPVAEVPESGIPLPDTNWTRYIQAGLRGVWEAEKDRLVARMQQADAAADGMEMRARTPTMGDGSSTHAGLVFPGLQLLVDGTIPPAAGLSSSSALVCASTLLASHAMRLIQTARGPPAKDCAESWSKLALASLSAHAERFIGTAGGGMDQAICFLAQRGAAMQIDFEPTLSCTGVSLPRSALLLVAHTGTRAEKARTRTIDVSLINVVSSI